MIPPQALSRTNGRVGVSVSYSPAGTAGVSFVQAAVERLVSRHCLQSRPGWPYQPTSAMNPAAAPPARHCWARGCGSTREPRPGPEPPRQKRPHRELLPWAVGSRLALYVFGLCRSVPMCTGWRPGRRGNARWRLPQRALKRMPRPTQPRYFGQRRATRKSDTHSSARVLCPSTSSAAPGRGSGFIVDPEGTPRPGTSDPGGAEYQVVTGGCGLVAPDHCSPSPGLHQRRSGEGPRVRGGHHDAGPARFSPPGHAWPLAPMWPSGPSPVRLPRGVPTLLRQGRGRMRSSLWIHTARVDPPGTSLPAPPARKN